MLEFSGQEQCALDGAGRLKLSAAMLRDFQRHEAGEVVLFCLPEGSVALYPPDIWRAMREAEAANAGLAARSLVARRSRRRFGALAQSAAISNQGRVTIPPLYREFADLRPGTDVMLVGCEIGVELWNLDRWRAELAAIHQHMLDKGEHEMSADLGDLDHAAVP